MRRAGLTGGSHDSYVKHMVKACRARGMRALAFNSRGTSDGPVRACSFTPCQELRRRPP